MANCGKLRDSLGHGEHTYIHMVSKYLTVLLIIKTKFPNPCQSLKTVAMKVNELCNENCSI